MGLSACWDLSLPGKLGDTAGAQQGCFAKTQTLGKEF